MKDNNSLIPKTGNPLMDINLLYKEFIGLTNIERAHEEDFVLKQLLLGKSRSNIIKELEAKHPEFSFTTTDFEKFLARNQNVVRAMGREVEYSARRHLEAKEQCSELLAGLVMYTQKLVQDFRDEGDNASTIAAIRALNSTLEQYMRLEGHIGNTGDGPVVNVINAVSEGKSRLKDRLHNANFIDTEIKKDDK